MQIHDQNTLLDALLEQYRDALAGDFDAYRNHCYRVLNFTLIQCENTADTVSKTAIAVAFHDLGIWQARTFDYLPPSRRMAKDYLIANEQPDWIDDVDAMIANHHKLRRLRNLPVDALPELFRRADWVDVTLGTLCFDLPRSFVTEVMARFPGEGFHKRLVQLTLKRMVTHPFSPLPMMRL